MSGGGASRRLLLVAASAALAGALLAPRSQLLARDPSKGELRSQLAFRVCADPDNLPFSNERGQGFENELARLFADALALPVHYTWHPQTIGFVRNTLGAQLCDVIMAINAAHELVQNTRFYYRSTYVLLYRAADRGTFDSLDSPMAVTARIGIVANTPPATLLERRGLIGNVVTYNLIVDTRVEHPAKQAVEDLAAGRIDMALLWGPIAGYWAKQSPVPLEWVPLRPDPGSNVPMDFRISMGVRYGETEWLETLNRLIREKQKDIDRILDAYGVPLLDARGRLVNPPPWLQATAARGG
ncbi:MAG: substrate-binding domain-containing protein [Geminicoccaceae bacterium]|nr:substrate-binding domain-containing protein [Geminicoccaceae bacterium]MDW8371783.1 substrate-binding domain-containing protein [Geminicoccaceae bacterium]